MWHKIQCNRNFLKKMDFGVKAPVVVAPTLGARAGVACAGSGCGCLVDGAWSDGPARRGTWVPYRGAVEAWRRNGVDARRRLSEWSDLIHPLTISCGDCVGGSSCSGESKATAVWDWTHSRAPDVRRVTAPRRVFTVCAFRCQRAAFASAGRTDVEKGTIIGPIPYTVVGQKRQTNAQVRSMRVCRLGTGQLHPTTDPVRIHMAVGIDFGSNDV
jgi:hypothetical protein